MQKYSMHKTFTSRMSKIRLGPCRDLYHPIPRMLADICIIFIRPKNVFEDCN